MARALWKGAIVFGLVNIPVDLYPGARSHTLDLDWIDKRDMAPVGYQRINKSTGCSCPSSCSNRSSVTSGPPHRWLARTIASRAE